jgi:acyl-CoA thioesterase FadM
MNLYFRLLFVLLAEFFRPKAPLTSELSLRFRAWPHDLDFNLHMNNGRYLTLMDLGRLQLMVRAGLVPTILKRRWMPVVGTVDMRFRRSLRPFQGFTLRTRLVSWDEKWVYLEQRFFVGEKLMAEGKVKALFLSGKRFVPTREILSFAGESPEPPPR